MLFSAALSALSAVFVFVKWPVKKSNPRAVKIGAALRRFSGAQIIPSSGARVNPNFYFYFF